MVFIILCYDLLVDPQFSEKEITLFTKRFENGYDLRDPRYEDWLHWMSEDVSPDPPSKSNEYVHTMLLT